MKSDRRANSKIRAITNGVVWAAVLAMGDVYIVGGDSMTAVMIFVVALPAFILYNASLFATQNSLQQQDVPVLNCIIACIGIIMLDIGLTMMYHTKYSFIFTILVIIFVQILLIMIELILEYIQYKQWPAPSVIVLFSKRIKN